MTSDGQTRAVTPEAGEKRQGEPIESNRGAPSFVSDVKRLTTDIVQRRQGLDAAIDVEVATVVIRDINNFLDNVPQGQPRLLGICQKRLFALAP